MIYSRLNNLKKTFTFNLKKTRKVSIHSFSPPHQVPETSPPAIHHKIQKLIHHIKMTNGKLGVQTLTFYCRSLVLQSIWRMSGAFPTFVTGMVAVSYDLSVYKEKENKKRKGLSPIQRVKSFEGGLCFLLVGGVGEV